MTPPAPSYVTGNIAEAEFALWAEARGWSVTKRGWPDFICRRGGELMCVEVKANPDVLSEPQRQTARDLTVRGVPVYEWRQPSDWDPADGELRPIADIHRVMLDQDLPASAAPAEVLAAADKAIETAEAARRQEEARRERAERAAAAAGTRAADAREKLRELRGDHDRLAGDAGYLLRHILDCRRHGITSRIRTLMRRYSETLRTDLKPLPGGGVAAVRPCGTGWPD
jgi:hypothetical protein